MQEKSMPYFAKIIATGKKGKEHFLTCESVDGYLLDIPLSGKFLGYARQRTFGNHLLSSWVSIERGPSDRDCYEFKKVFPSEMFDAIYESFYVRDQKYISPEDYAIWKQDHFAGTVVQNGVSVDLYHEISNLSFSFFDFLQVI